MWHVIIYFESFSDSDWHSIANSICNPAESLTKNQPFDIFHWCQKTWFAYCILMAHVSMTIWKSWFNVKKKNLGQNILAFGFFMAKIGISSTIKQSSQEKFSPQFEFSIYILSKCKNVKVVKLLLLHFNFLFWDEEDFFWLKEKLVEDRFSHYSYRIFFISLAWSHKCAVLLWRRSVYYKISNCTLLTLRYQYVY